MADFTEVLFGTVFNEHGERRQIQRLTNNLKSSSGIERIPFNGIDELDTEQGPAGEAVHALNSGDSRIRFVGSGWDIVSEANPATNLRTPSTTDYVEITFFGTGLNILTITNSGTRTIIPVVDGVTGADIYPEGFNDILEGRNTKTNQILPVRKGLSAGVHTIRLSQTNASPGTPFSLYGCEIINENAGITQQSGADFDGRVSTLSGTTFPIEPDNTTVPSINSTTNVVEGYGTRTLGARVLNYLTSGGQYKQSFVPVVTKTLMYEAIIDTTAGTTWNIPATVTSFTVVANAAGGQGGAATFRLESINGRQSLGAGSGGGGGAFLSTTYAKTAGAGGTLTFVNGAGGSTTSSTITGGGTGLSGSVTLPAGANGIGVDRDTAPANTENFVSGSGGNGGTAPANANITGLTASSTTLTSGIAGTDASYQTSPGNFSGTSRGTTAGSGGNSGPSLGGVGGNGGVLTTGTGQAPPAAGEVPGAGGGGQSVFFNGGGDAVGSFFTGNGQASNQSVDGATGGTARVVIRFTGSAGLGTQGAGFREVLDRSDEEIVRRVNFREFGANNAFAGTISNANAAFTLDDGTTTLVGNSVEDSGITFPAGIEALSMGALTDFITLTFVGTGLDIFAARQTTATPTVSFSVSVDGATAFNTAPIPTNFIGIIPIVSGLAYGTHTVRFQVTNTQNVGIADFIIYGPKKPEIPTLDVGSLELSDYNVMADYSATTSNAYGRRSSGVLGKTSFREFLYSGAVEIQNHLLTVLMPFGRVVEVHTESTGYFEYTFYGTGIELYASTVNESDTSPNTITLDGVALGTTGTVVPIASTYSTTTSIWSRTAGTNVPGQLYTLVPYILQVSGLPLGVHTIRATRTATDNGSTGVDGAFIITPIHINDDTLKLGSEGLNNLTIDPVVEEDEQVVLANLGEAKAWLHYNGVTGEVLSSHNIAAVIGSFSGNSNTNWSMQAYFEKPFKDNKYVALATGSTVSTGGGGDVCITYNASSRANFSAFSLTARTFSNLGGQTTTASGGIAIAWYGELIDE